MVNPKRARTYNSFKRSNSDAYVNTGDRSNCKSTCTTISNSDSMITLISIDGERFQVPVEVARMSKVLGTILDEHDYDCEDDNNANVNVNTNINDSNDKDIFTCFRVQVPSHTLSKVIDYCTHYTTVDEMVEIDHLAHHPDKTMREMVPQDWYVNFIDSISTSILTSNSLSLERDKDGNRNSDELKRLISAADYLDIEPLISLGIVAMCVIASGSQMSAEELSDFFEGI